MLFYFFLYFFINENLIFCREICYGDLGCFTDSYPFSLTLARPIALLPQSPEKIATKFILHSRKTSTFGEVISADKISQHFEPKIPTKFIVHGFVTATYPWVYVLKDVLIRTEDMNVILVDWSKGNGLPYTQATANTQIVGAEIAKLINTMINTTGALAKDFHLIGHSLAAHICGYAGSRIEGLGKITGLDPAGPYYEYTDPKVRLDPSDALFVEVLHTDGTATLKIGMGLFQESGHGGKNQPGCAEISGKLLGAIYNGITFKPEGNEQTTCSHSSAYIYYTESITDKTCKFTAYPCSSEDDFNAGKCLKCTSPNGCNRMGYYSSPINDHGSLYLNTQDSSFSRVCLQNYALNLYSNNLTGMQQTRGKFTIWFKTHSQEASPVEIFDDSEITFKRDSVETRLISLKKPILSSAIESAVITFTKTKNIISSWLYDSQWSFKFIEIISGDYQELFRLCPLTPIIHNTQSVEFLKC